MAYDKVVDSAMLDGALTGIADAIRGKTGGTEKLTLEGMAAAIAGIQAGGDTTAEDGLITGSVVEYRNDRIQTVRTNGFSECGSLVSVDLPNVTRINGYAFSFCRKLTRINLPKLSAFSQTYHFQACSALEMIKLPSITKLENNSFDRCSSLKTVVLPQSYVVALAETSVFGSTPFATNGTGGTVYCPAALIEQYRAATNWATLYTAGTCNFVAIEGSAYE